MFSIVYGHSLMLLPCHGSPWNGVIKGNFWDASAPCVVVLMFFFLSGWLQKTKSRILDVRKFLYLALPVVIWNMVQLVVENGVHVFQLSKLASLGIWPTFTEADKPLWFLDELAWFSLFLPLIARIPILVRGFLVLAGFVVLYWLNPRGEIIWDRQLKFAMDCWFFFSGTLLAGVDRAKITYIWLKVAPWIFLLGTCYVWGGMIGLQVNGIPAYTIVYALVGLVCLLSQGAVLERFFPRVAGLVVLLAPSVFFIYAVHWPLFTLWGKVETHFGICRLNAYLYPIYTVVCFCLCIIAFFIARRYLPAKMLELFFLYKKPKRKSVGA